MTTGKKKHWLFCALKAGEINNEHSVASPVCVVVPFCPCQYVLPETNCAMYNQPVPVVTVLHSESQMGFQHRDTL